MKSLVFFQAVIFVFVSCSSNKSKNSVDHVDNTPQEISYSVIARYPHNTASYTEGLLINNGQLYESTGGQQQLDTFKSWFGSVDLVTGKVVKKVMLDTSYFGEGINIFNGHIYQLTYKNNIGLIYDTATFRKVKEFTYNGEGWALTNDGTRLIMSNGSSILQFLDPTTLKVVKVLNVQDNNGPVANINELEFIDGYIYANQYLTNYILKINLATGNVTGKLDCSKLVKEAKQAYAGSLELNGIAYDSSSGNVYVTGKAWPYLYQVKF